MQLEEACWPVRPLPCMELGLEEHPVLAALLAVPLVSHLSGAGDHVPGSECTCPCPCPPAGAPDFNGTLFCDATFGSCYSTSPATLSWTNANVTCKARGGSLVMYNSLREVGSRAQLWALGIAGVSAHDVLTSNTTANSSSSTACACRTQQRHAALAACGDCWCLWSLPQGAAALLMCWPATRVIHTNPAPAAQQFVVERYFLSRNTLQA